MEKSANRDIEIIDIKHFVKHVWQFVACCGSVDKIPKQDNFTYKGDKVIYRILLHTMFRTTGFIMHFATLVSSSPRFKAIVMLFHHR
jgi:hypothetical protein